MKNKLLHLFIFLFFFLFLIALLNPIYGCSFISGYTSIEIDCGIGNADSSYFVRSEIIESDELITMERSRLNDSGIQIDIYSDKAEEFGRITPGIKVVLQNELNTTLPDVCSVDITYLQDNLIEDLESRLNPVVDIPDGAFYIFETKTAKANLVDQINQIDDCRYPVYEVQDQWIIGKMSGTREYCTNSGLCGYPEINSGEYIPFLFSNLNTKTFPYLFKHLIYLSPLLIFAITIPISVVHMIIKKKFVTYFTISVVTTPISLISLFSLNYSEVINSKLFSVRYEMLISPFLLGSVAYLLWVWWRGKKKKLRE